MLKSHLLIAWRNILRSKSYSLINISGLTLGVACCLLLTLYIQDEVSFDRHHAHLDDLYRVTTTFEGVNAGIMGTVSPPIAQALRQEIPEVEAAARLVIPPGASQNLIRYQDKLFYESEGAIADSSLFDVLTYEFIEGRPAHALTDSRSVVLTDKLAQRLFGKNPALNQVISIDGVGTGDFKVTGVIKSNVKTFMPVRFIISMNSTGGLADYLHSDHVANAWAGQNFVPTFLRLSPGHDRASVIKKINQVLQKFGAEDMKARGMQKTLGLEPIKDIYLRSSIDQRPRITYIYIVGSIATFILLIAAINFINLSTARAAKRAAEIGVRKVLGAFRSSLIRQILSEAMVIVMISIGLSLVVVKLALPTFNELTEKSISLGSGNTGYFALALALLTIVTGLLAGGYPAFYVSSFQPVDVLKGKFTMNHASGWLRRSLVIFQFVIAITLVCGMIIVTRQLNYMQEKDLGFDARAKIIVPLRTDGSRAHYDDLRNSFNRLGGIQSVSGADYVPGSPIYSDARLYIDGGNVDNAISILCNNVDSHYIDLLSIPMVAGRPFTDNRKMESERKIILNRTAAKAYGVNPDAIIGQHLYFERQGKKTDYEIIGVMEDYHQVSLKEEIRPTLFQIPDDAFGYQFMVVNLNTSDFHRTVDAIEKTWKGIIDSTPFEYAFLDENIQKQYLSDQKVSKIIRAFTIIAMLISSLGLYGLSAFMAERRFKEIGIRKVMGASIGQITQLMSGEFVKLVTVAFAISVPVAWYVMDHWLEGFAYKIPVDSFVFINAGIAAMIIALITISFESIRAASANPVDSLRTKN